MKSLLVAWMSVFVVVPLTSVASAQYGQYQQPVYRPPVYQQPAYGQRVYQSPQFNGQPSYPPGTLINGQRIIPTQPGATALTNANRTPAMNVSTMKRPWYADLVKDREHDFGTVALATKQVHVFEFKNTTGSDLFLTYVKASCGCTKPTILTPHVKPGEIGKVKAEFDTRNFYGDRGATLTVSINKSGQYTEYGELQLAVKGSIRRDVVLNPGEFDFQDVTLSEAVQKTARVLYAGRPDWKILEVKSTNPNISAETREIERNPATGRTSYEMVVKVNEKQAPGAFNETLTIITNDPKTTGMPVRIGGNVKPIIDVAPIALGVVNKGQAIKKRLIVRSPQAISIEAIETGNDKIKFEPSQGKKTLHILTYSLDTSDPMDIDQSITIVTNDSQVRRTQVPFSVQVVPATNTNANQ